MMKSGVRSEHKPERQGAWGYLDGGCWVTQWSGSWCCESAKNQGWRESNEEATFGEHGVGGRRTQGGFLVEKGAAVLSHAVTAVRLKGRVTSRDDGQLGVTCADSADWTVVIC